MVITKLSQIGSRDVEVKFNKGESEEMSYIFWVIIVIVYFMPRVRESVQLIENAIKCVRWNFLDYLMSQCSLQ